MNRPAMSRRSLPAIRFASALAIMLRAPVGAQTITVVNMIPARWSSETTQNSEPSLAVNALIPSFLAASVLPSSTRFCQPGIAPLLVSRDEGNTWDFACNVPTYGPNSPSDVTVRFSGDAKSLAASAMTFSVGNDGTFRWIASVNGWFSATTTIDALFNPDLIDNNPFGAPTQLYAREQTDQPQLGTAALTANGASALLWIGNHRSNNAGAASDTCHYLAASVVQNAFAGLTVSCLAEDRPPFPPTLGSVPSSRVAMAGGRTYVVMYRPAMNGTGQGMTVSNLLLKHDVVVYRKDNQTFDIIRDTPATQVRPPTGTQQDCQKPDSLIGKRVAMCRLYTYLLSGTGTAGQERRVASELSIAVHPTNPDKVVVAWAETPSPSAGSLDLHFAHSEDGGVNWTEEPRWTISHAINPALAIASDSAIGILFQALESNGTRWNTKIAISTDWFQTPPTLPTLLASVAANQPSSGGLDPYLGDYLELQARGKSFYGVFSASNDLTPAIGNSFPSLCSPTICTKQRRYAIVSGVNTGPPLDSNGHSVRPSIDPYFVRVNRELPGPSPAITTKK